MMMDDACEQTSAQLQQGGGQQKQDFEVVLSFSSSFSVLEFSTNKKCHSLQHSNIPVCEEIPLHWRTHNNLEKVL